MAFSLNTGKHPGIVNERELKLNKALAWGEDDDETVIYFLSAAVIVPFPQEIYVADYPIRISVFIGSSVLNQSFLGS
ncbi:hypothetical protein [Sarcina sp. DSM 11001]|uniref:hypothetical protein n=1 Tax=Sarcina sp. DSM 11001 TaxID=1798184 RepID=UPI0011142B15|nr:hypothetical protein [Sarcina sp. DSM 11001]